MSRTLAILLVVCFLVLMAIAGMTDRMAEPLDMVWAHMALQVALLLGMFCYCGFAALHSTQRIDSPQKRSTWLIATLGMNVFGSCVYYCTVYQDFRKKGQGGLL